MGDSYIMKKDKLVHKIRTDYLVSRLDLPKSVNKYLIFNKVFTVWVKRKKMSCLNSATEFTYSVITLTGIFYILFPFLF